MLSDAIKLDAANTAYLAAAESIFSKDMPGSFGLITEQTDVSLNSAMKSFTTGGSTSRNARGTTTRRSASGRDMPSDSAASSCPGGNACSPAR
jgi:hypothetical protein